MATDVPRVQLLQALPRPDGTALPRGLRLQLERALPAGRVLARVPGGYGLPATVVLESHEYRRVAAP